MFITKNIFAVSFLIFLSTFTLEAQVPEKKEYKTSNEWVSIFDGKTLNGWKASQEGFFSVENGAITGKTSEYKGTKARVNEEPQAASLVWQGGNISNFNLRYKAYVSGSLAHAGFHFRSVINEQKLRGGYQADISGNAFFEGILRNRPFENYASAGQINLIEKVGGKIVTSFESKESLLEGIDFNQWVSYEISAHESHLILRTNGRRILELIDQRGDDAPQSGVLGIALYPFSGMKVQIKDIELQTLSPKLVDSHETILTIENIHLIDELETELNAGTSRKALELLRENPHLTNVTFGGKTNATSSGGTIETPLLLASHRGHVEVVKWLIAHGATINQACYNDFLPIHLAANAEIAKLLIKAGAKLDALTSFGQTPLQYAATRKLQDVVTTILESGYKLDILSAIKLERSDLVASIIKQDPSTINAPKAIEKEVWRQQESPLMTAVRLQNVGITELLINAGADVHDSYRLGGRSGPPHCDTVTALSIAVVFSNIDLIKLLLQSGANPSLDCDGRSLLDYAKEYRTPEIVALLEKEYSPKSK